MESYIEDKKKLYYAIIDFTEASDENPDETNKQYFKNLFEIIKNQHIEEDKEEMTQFLLIIKNISDNHHRNGNFIKRIYQILDNFKDQIKHTLSEIEIYHIFEDSKLILLFLLKTDIITISDAIYIEMIGKIELNGNRYCHFFYPEIEKSIEKEEIKEIKNELLSINSNIFENYDENRQEGQNDRYICSLIRQDSIVDFISHVNRQNISHSSQILPSIFETNSFLIENKNTTLIEYAAFFGSIQIFQYLHNSGAKLTPSLWLYAIHSNNAELIQFLESNKVSPPKCMNTNKYDDSSTNYLQCFIESIKCHHKDLAYYFENNLLTENNKENEAEQEEITSSLLKYHNYVFLQTESLINHGFFYLSFYNYNKLFDILYKAKEKDIKLKIIQKSIFVNQTNFGTIFFFNMILILFLINIV